MEIKFQNVMAFISDNASYMSKAFKSLKTILFNCTHVACFAHIIALVGETWRSNLSEVDLIVANLKSIFARGSNRKKRFIDFLKSNEKENPSYYPSPVVTRWNTWFKAVSYISKNLFKTSELKNNSNLLLLTQELFPTRSYVRFL
ncbi:unnamed protein product [Brachionus calyciflorus]|uniref:DUF659 domain-containing protein n=1 Tax=Brachionus calyciflorus TaxID=104777 RepID=A0A814KRT2_9BILA|nr:unnamed protein product [Brachionus calyciflorus]